MDQARFDGVEIDDRGAFSSDLVDHDVRDLGIPVDGPVPQFLPGEGIFQHRDEGAAFLDEPGEPLGFRGSIAIPFPRRVWRSLHRNRVR